MLSQAIKVGFESITITMQQDFTKRFFFPFLFSLLEGLNYDMKRFFWRSIPTASTPVDGVLGRISCKK